MTGQSPATCSLVKQGPPISPMFRQGPPACLVVGQSPLACLVIGHTLLACLVMGSANTPPQKAVSGMSLCAGRPSPVALSAHADPGLRRPSCTCSALTPPRQASAERKLRARDLHAPQGTSSVGGRADGSVRALQGPLPARRPGPGILGSACFTVMTHPPRVLAPWSAASAAAAAPSVLYSTKAKPLEAPAPSTFSSTDTSPGSCAKVTSRSCCVAYRDKRKWQAAEHLRAQRAEDCAHPPTHTPVPPPPHVHPPPPLMGRRFAGVGGGSHHTTVNRILVYPTKICLRRL